MYLKMNSYQMALQKLKQFNLKKSINVTNHTK